MRSAISLSFNPRSIRRRLTLDSAVFGGRPGRPHLRCRHRRPFEERREVLEAEFQRDVADLPGALLGLQTDGTAELGERRTLLGTPANNLEAASRTHHG